MISDNNYVMPTCVTIQSIVDSNLVDSNIYIIHILAASLSQDVIEQFMRLQTNRVKVDIIEVNANCTFKEFKELKNESICSASIASLFKFLIPKIFPQLDKILYLDGDIIVKTGIDEIYNTDVNDFYGAAVIDSGSIYFRHEFVEKVDNYFNSGVMLLNLNKLRNDDIPKKLYDTKKKLNDKLLMDQNVFNLVLNKKMYLLPIKYNFMPVSLNRANDKWTINDINAIYRTTYKNKKTLFSDAAIIHYSSKDKPWKCLDGAYSYYWVHEYLRTPIKHDLITPPSEKNKYKYKISIIMPCFNVEKYVSEAIQSVLNQSFSSYEIICLDDGSTDKTLSILKIYEQQYSNVKVYSNANRHQGWERNFGVSRAQGEYIYYMDSDDILDKECLSLIYTYAKENSVDLLFFEGKTFFENKQLEEKYTTFINAYSRKESYPCIYNGPDIYIKLRTNGDFIVSPCLQLISHDFICESNLKFPNLNLLEDNLYIFHAILKANRVLVLTNELYKRRIRSNSTMTKENSIEERIDALIYIITEMHTYLPIYGHTNDKLYDTIFQHIFAFMGQIGENLNILHKKYHSNFNVQLIKIILEQKQKILVQNKEIKNIKSGYSFRIGRVITFLPRKIRGGIRCYKEHGMKYTIKRTLYHMGLYR